MVITHCIIHSLAFGGDEDLDPDLLRALEESRRTYQLESGQMAVEGGSAENAGSIQADANDLANAFSGMDLEEDFDAAVRLIFNDPLTFLVKCSIVGIDERVPE